MSAWDVIGKAAATQRGTPFASGTRGSAAVKALRMFQSNNGDGHVLVLESQIVESVAQSAEHITDLQTKSVAKTIVQSPGTDVSSVFMLTKHKAAPGAAKAMLMAIVGITAEEEFPEVRKLCEVNDGQALKGYKFNFETYPTLTKDKRTIYLVRYSHCTQTESEIEEMTKKLG